MAESGKNRRRRGRRKRGQSGSDKQEKQTTLAQQRTLYTAPDDPMRNYLPPPPDKREYEPDPVSGEPIADPVTAICHPTTGRPMNIDTVIRTLTEQEQLTEQQEIAYIGSGCFGVVETKRENGRTVVQVLKKIPYEDTHDKQSWRRELSPGISRDYVPQPAPLLDLYSQEELKAFPRLGASATAYLPKSG